MNVRTRSFSGTFECNDGGEIILVDKPLGWSSFDVVKKMRSMFSARKIGHAGTLDPQATGLLIVCTGPKTKSVDLFAVMEKEYTGIMELGVETESYDSETAVVARKELSGISTELLESTARLFEGKLMQQPPMYSASKYGGKPLYYYARRGKTVVRAEKEIEVKEFALTGFSSPNVEFRIVCSKGTYIRSLVHDFGKALGCGATLRSLRRTRIGTFTASDAFTLDELMKTKAGTAAKAPHDYRATA